MQRANDAVIAANNYQGVVPNRDRKKFPRFNNLTRVPDEHPLSLKNPLHIRHVHRGVRVKFLRHRMSLAPRGNQVSKVQRSIRLIHAGDLDCVVGTAFQRVASRMAAIKTDAPRILNSVPQP